MRCFVYSTAIALMLCSTASASLVIDDFSSAVSINGAGSDGPDTVPLGTRSITLSNVSFGSGVSSGSNVFTATFGNTFASTQLSMVYDFTSPIDLHSAGSFPGSPMVLDLFDVVDGTFALDVIYEGVAGSATTQFSISGTGPIGVPGTAFGNGALASAVDRITLNFRATSLVPDGFGGNFARFSSSSASISAVPEPTSLALLGASMFGGFGVVARRRKKKIVEEAKA